MKPLRQEAHDQETIMFKRNRIELTGNLACAAQTEQAGEATVTRARIIHNESVYRAGGDPIEQLVAIDIEIWGRRGKAFEHHVTTKTPVYIEGRLQLDEWGKGGQRHYRLFVRVSDWQFLGPKATTPNQANAA